MKKVYNFYGLAEQPFGVTPDPRYLYFSPTHREALASLLRSAGSGCGFSALIAKPGMGKTTLLFDFLNMAKDLARSVFLCQTQFDQRDFLRSLLADLGIEDDGSDSLRMHRKLNDCLLEVAKEGKQLFVIIDEAQNLDDHVLELVRMLSNFESPRKKLMHLILAGQPQLAEKLSSPGLWQLRQRISVVARLAPFTPQETQKYIEHRLHVAGYTSSIPFFSAQAMEAIAAHSKGIPRSINNICFNAMAIGCALRQQPIEASAVHEALADLDLRPLCPSASLPAQGKPAAAAVSPLRAVPKPASLLSSWRNRAASALPQVSVMGWRLTKDNRVQMNAKAKGLEPARESVFVQTHEALHDVALQTSSQQHASAVPGGRLQSVGEESRWTQAGTEVAPSGVEGTIPR